MSHLLFARVERNPTDNCMHFLTVLDHPHDLLLRTTSKYSYVGIRFPQNYTVFYIIKISCASKRRECILLIIINTFNTSTINISTDDLCTLLLVSLSYPLALGLSVLLLDFYLFLFDREGIGPLSNLGLYLNALHRG